MKMDNARILVIGAGVNGSICAANRIKPGLTVTVLARGQRSMKKSATRASSLKTR